jgi:hypothetical protein
MRGINQVFGRAPAKIEEVVLAPICVDDRNHFVTAFPMVTPIRPIKIVQQQYPVRERAAMESEGDPAPDPA